MTAKLLTGLVERSQFKSYCFVFMDLKYLCESDPSSDTKEVTTGDRELATETVEEESSLLLAREIAALGSHQSGFSMNLDTCSG